MMTKKLHFWRATGELLILAITIALLVSPVVASTPETGTAVIPEEILPHFPGGGLLYLEARSLPQITAQTLKQPVMEFLAQETGHGEISEIIDSELSKVAPGLNLDSLSAMFPGELAAGIYHRDKKTQFLLGLQVGDVQKFSTVLQQMQSAKGTTKVEVKKKMVSGFNFQRIRITEYPSKEKSGEYKTKVTEVYLAFNDRMLLVSRDKKLTTEALKNFDRDKTPLNQETALVDARGELSSNVQLYVLIDGQELAGVFKEKLHPGDKSQKDLSSWTGKIFSGLGDLESIALGFSYPIEENALSSLAPTDEVSIRLMPNSDLSSLFKQWKGVNAEKKAPLVVPEDATMLVDVSTTELFYPKSELFTPFLSYLLSWSDVEKNAFSDIYDLLPAPPELSFLKEDTLKSYLGNESAIVYLPGETGIDFLSTLAHNTEYQKQSLKLYSIKQTAEFEDKYLGYLEDSDLTTVETSNYQGINIYHLAPTQSAEEIDQQALSDWVNSFLQQLGGSNSENQLSPDFNKAYIQQMAAELQKLYATTDSYVFFLSDFMVIAYDQNCATRTIDQYLNGKVLGDSPKFLSYLSHLNSNNYSLIYVSEFMPQTLTFEENPNSRVEELLQSMLNEGFILTSTLGENSLKLEGYPQALNKLFMSIFYSAFSAYKNFGDLSPGSFKHSQLPERQNPLLSR
jgi:hypothetical protein